MSLVKPGEAVMVILDSCHGKEHVRAELEAYHDLISSQLYIIATDGITQDLHDVPPGKAEWLWDYPAASEFSQQHAEFELAQPGWAFNESELSKNITHWPGSWLKRK
jgi:cephalosporin hydroxylase